MTLGQSVRVTLMEQGQPVILDGVIVGSLPEFDSFDIRIGATRIEWNLPAKQIEEKWS